MNSRKTSLVIAVLLASAVPFAWCRAETEPPKKKKPPAATNGTVKPAQPTKPAQAKPAAAGSSAVTDKSNPGKPVDLGGKNDGKTINFTSGKPVITDTPEDKVAINSALKDFNEASKNITFGPTKKKSESAPKN